MSNPAVYDHLRPTDGEVPDGIYRVVGTGADSVTLLRVGDAEARRVNTGDVRTVASDSLDGFESAANPDGNRPAGAVLSGAARMLYWSVLAFGQQLLRRPLPTALALALVVAGAVGDSYVSAPDEVFGALLVLGALGLTLVGGGRL